MSRRSVFQQLRNWSGIVALLVSAVTLLTAAKQSGRDAQKVDGKLELLGEKKLDRERYLEDQNALTETLGRMEGDVRVIRAAVCASSARACPK